MRVDGSQPASENQYGVSSIVIDHFPVLPPGSEVLVIVAVVAVVVLSKLLAQQQELVVGAAATAAAASGIVASKSSQPLPGTLYQLPWGAAGVGGG